MKPILQTSSIRTRLLVAYLGILIVGFACLTAVAGDQIASASRADYEQRLINEIHLIAQGIRPYVIADDAQDNDELDAIIDEYESQINGELEIIRLDKAEENRPPDMDISEENLSSPLPRPPITGEPEIEAALHGGIIIFEREDADGKSMFYTAAPIFDHRQTPVFIQLAVPTQNLRDLMIQRWIVLWFIFALVTTLALFVTILISRSITRPLITLRESANRLSQGDFSHRVAYTGVGEIGEVAQAFNEMGRQVEGMLEEQRAFASNTAHELRTPLTTIRLRSEALRHDTQLEANVSKRYIAEIDDEVTRLGSLIEDLTLLSRFDAGRAELGQGQIDLVRFATNMRQQMLSQTNAKNIQIELVMPNKPLVVNASLNHLSVVFRNLLDNAIKYTPNGCEITWHISEGIDGICNIIQDTGRGIEPEHLPHLFERFYRADKSRSRHIPGTGLGLALTKSIVEAYGGLITIESDGDGHGTTATVLWPSYYGNEARASLNSDE